MKNILLLLLLQPFSLILGINDISVKLLEGEWCRTYSVYRPWTDDNQGTFSYYEEVLMFDTNNIVFIYDSSSEESQGKSVYTILKRNNKDFIVFYKPNQNPKNNTIQIEQGFFVTITYDDNGVEILTLTTIKEEKKKKPSSISYKKIEHKAKSIQFITPQNKS